MERHSVLRAAFPLRRIIITTDAVTDPGWNVIDETNKYQADEKQLESKGA